MENLNKYNQIFQSIFNAELSELNDSFDSGNIPKWDSVSHLILVTSIEEEFDIILDSEDILGFRSYPIGKEILGKYGVSL